MSDIGYDDHDKEVVRLMQLNGEILGGLILSDDHPDWVNKPMEELFDLIRKEREHLLPPDEPEDEPGGTGGTGGGGGTGTGGGGGSPQGPQKGPKIPQAYADAWNAIMQQYDRDEISEADLHALIKAISEGSITEI